MILLSIGMALSKSILISILISNTSYQMKYEINIDSITTIIYSFYQLLIFTRSARIVETSIHSFIFMIILVIDLNLTYWNESGSLTVCRFGISIHDSIIQYQTRKRY